MVDGVSRTLNRLVKDLNAHEYQTYIIAPTRDPPALEHYGALLPAPAMKLPFRGEYSFATGLDRCVRELLEEFDPEIVHVATPDVLGQQVQRMRLIACIESISPHANVSRVPHFGTLVG